MKKGENIGIFSNWDIYDSLNHSSFEGDDFTCDINIVNEYDIGRKTEKQNIIMFDSPGSDFLA